MRSFSKFPDAAYVPQELHTRNFDPESAGHAEQLTIAKKRPELRQPDPCHPTDSVGSVELEFGWPSVEGWKFIRQAPLGCGV